MNKKKYYQEIAGYYQLIGGLISILSLIFLLTLGRLVQATASLYLLMGFMFLLFCFSTWCGYSLLKGVTRRSIRLSYVNQFLQLISFSISGISFLYCSGIGAVLSIDLSHGFIIGLHFNLSGWNFSVGTDESVLALGVNLVPVGVGYLIGRVEKG